MILRPHAGGATRRSTRGQPSPPAFAPAPGGEGKEAPPDSGALEVPKPQLILTEPGLPDQKQVSTGPWLGP